MSEDKKYPLTELKRKELRRKGIIPYSPLSLRSLLIGIFLIATGFAYTDGVTFKFDQNYLREDPDQYASLFYRTAFYLLAFSLTGFFATFISALIQTSFLFIPFGKYPDGVRAQSSNISISKVFKFSIFLLTILSLLGVLLGFFYSIFRKEYIRGISEDTSLQFFYLLRITSFSQILYITGFMFLLVSTIAFIYSKLAFFDVHKMSKSEILEEMTDS
jgi:flagellar biosynthesis protein FlhB